MLPKKRLNIRIKDTFSIDLYTYTTLIFLTFQQIWNNVLNSVDFRSSFKRCIGLQKIRLYDQLYFHHFRPKYHRRHLTMKSIKRIIYEVLLYDKFQGFFKIFEHWSKPMGRRVITILYVWVLHLINLRHNPIIWYNYLSSFCRSLTILGFYSTQK